MKEKVSVGIDIGDSQVVTVIGHRAEGEAYPNIVGVGIHKGSGMRRGVVTDVEETVASISAAVEEAERMAGLPAEAVYVSVNGEHIAATNNKGLIAIPRSKEEIGHDDVLRVVETAQSVTVPANREILHVIPRMFMVDGQEGIKDPVGMTGSRLEVDAHVITGSTPFIKNLRRTVEQAGVAIAGFVLAPLAASKSVLTKKQKELGVVLIDIGAGTTGLVVFEEGDIYHSAVLPIGSDHITSDIAIGLRTSLDVAERVKVEYGMASPITLSDKDTIDLSKLDRDEEQEVSRRYLAEIIEARLQELFLMIKAELRKVGRDGMLPAGAILVGGGAKLPGIVESAKDNLGLPAQLGFPVELKGMIDKLDDPRYATAIGIMLWGMDDESEKTVFPTFDVSSVITRIKELFSK
ncbi:MAG: cell division protein FtsA [Patescibacteria group bacterium]|nr:cell division protein FtsA [Patescibacteria group bacterium]